MVDVAKPPQECNVELRDVQASYGHPRRIQRTCLRCKGAMTKRSALRVLDDGWFDDARLCSSPHVGALRGELWSLSSYGGRSQLSKGSVTPESTFECIDNLPGDRIPDEGNTTASQQPYQRTYPMKLLSSHSHLLQPSIAILVVWNWFVRDAHVLRIFERSCNWIWA